MDVRVAANAIQQEALFPGIDQQTRADISTIILELGTNIVKYAGSGRILLRSLASKTGAGIEVLAVDEGPGIPDPERALQDRFTTGNTLGLGLGVVRRLCHSFELQCPEQGGTRVRAITWWGTAPCKGKSATRANGADLSSSRRALGAPAVQPAPTRPLNFTSITRNRPALHQSSSGDALLILNHGPLGFRIVLDGAGHGPIAHQLSRKASEAIKRCLSKHFYALPLDADGGLDISERDIDTLMLDTINTTHEQIRSSRGVAVGMAVFDGNAHRLHFLGIGNTRILLLSVKGWEGVSRDGQLGVTFKSPLIHHYPLNPDDVVLQSSDGIRTSTLRSMRPTRQHAPVDVERVANDLLARTSFTDDVSVLLTRCHA